MFRHSLRIAVLLSILLAHTTHAGRPAHMWSRSFDGSNFYEEATCVAIDGDGNVIMGGGMQGGYYPIGDPRINLGGGTVYGSGSSSGFVGKYASDGTYLWGDAFSIGVEDAYLDVATDGTGNVILVGYYNTANGFIEKRAPGGTRAWLKHLIVSYPSQMAPTQVAVFDDGSIVCAGYLTGTGDLSDLGGGTLTSAGQTDVFAIKLDSGGNLTWAQTYGGAGRDILQAVAVDPAGDVVLAGYFAGGDIDFGGGALVWSGGNPTSHRDIFMAKLDGAGGHMWSQSFGSADHSCEAPCVAIEESGAIRLAGPYDGSIDFGGGMLTSASGTVGFLTKFDDAGSHLSSRSIDGFAPTSIADDGFGHGYLADYYGSLKAYDDAGTFTWEGRLGNNAYRVAAIAMRGSSILVLTGWLQNPVDFGGGPVPHYAADDPFLASFMEAPLPTLLSRFDAVARESGIEVRWELSVAGEQMEFEVLRKRGDDGRFEALADPAITRTGLAFTLLDGGVEPGSAYRYRVAVSDADGTRLLFETDPIRTPDAASAIQDNTPNPFRAATRITYVIPSASAVRLAVYDVHGRLIAVLVNGKQGAGRHAVEWDGRDDRGEAVASGVYFLRLQSATRRHVRKITLVR